MDGLTYKIAPNDDYERKVKYIALRNDVDLSVAENMYKADIDNNQNNYGALDNSINVVDTTTNNVLKTDRTVTTTKTKSTSTSKSSTSSSTVYTNVTDTKDKSRTISINVTPNKNSDIIKYVYEKNDVDLSVAELMYDADVESGLNQYGTFNKSNQPISNSKISSSNTTSSYVNGELTSTQTNTTSYSSDNTVWNTYGEVIGINPFGPGYTDYSDRASSTHGGNDKINEVWLP